MKGTNNGTAETGMILMKTEEATDTTGPRAGGGPSRDSVVPLNCGHFDFHRIMLHIPLIVMSGGISRVTSTMNTIITMVIR